MPLLKIGVVVQGYERLRMLITPFGPPYLKGDAQLRLPLLG
jgi:hypothetical protein